jgi:CheY-like chemotaxis protein
LIVDDDRDIRETLKELVEQEGFAAICAENGEDALIELRRGDVLPCVILLDLTMPVMDGFAFRAAQLADPALAAVPVVVMTADGNLEDKRKRIGAERALKKPMEVDELVEVIAVYART